MLMKYQTRLENEQNLFLFFITAYGYATAYFPIS